MVLSDCYSWDNEQFGHARLGDPRRTRRLVSLASSLAQHAGLNRPGFPGECFICELRL
ncbi:hypothetical protein HEN82_019355, partial [Escherichia coli]|nr:hypothetical protein [Escherichia coli]